MLYEIYRQILNGDDVLIDQNLTEEQADQLCSKNQDYIKVPQQINGN